MLINFVKQNKIGSGSFGKVYKVFNKKTGEIQACKISILPLESLNDDEIKNLEREINIISKLNFPSILKFVGFNPKNFKKEQRPTFITEFVSNGSLDTILDLEQKGLSNEDWNDTKKLIIIYGIASGMAYLHSHDIIHRDLKPGNIFIDEFMFPKIGDFGLSKTIKQNKVIFSKDVNKKIESFSGLKGTVPFMSPEIITDNNYIKAGDVYAFAIIVHQIIVNEELFKGWFRLQIMFNVKNGYRPPIPHNIPLCYKELIEKCWNEDPKQRPTFNEIVELLKTNPDFITDTVDQNEFNDYIDYLDEIQNNHSNLLNKQFHKVSFDLKNNDDIDNENQIFLDMTMFEKIKLQLKGETWKLYHVKNKNTGKLYSAKIYTVKLDKLNKKEILNLSREINIISKIKHPSILTFIGYSQKDFFNKHRPVILTEFTSYGTLSSILDQERNGKFKALWNNTKKLINIFGIAEGMRFLHSQDIVHRDLTPENIFLNDKLEPKIGNFGLSIFLHTKKSLTFQSTIGLKGNPSFSAPEVLQMNKYSKSSDVYSFGMIVYQVITKEIPFSYINGLNDLFDEVVTKSARPMIKEEVSESYRKLINICWHSNPDKRPTFDDIIFILKSDPGFITDGINKEEYNEYIKSFENANFECFDDKEILNKDDLFKKNVQEENKIEEIDDSE